MNTRSKLWIAVVALMALMLTACTEEKEQGLQADELLSRSQEAVGKVESYALAMELKQDLDTGSGQETFSASSRSSVEVEPFQMQQTVTSQYGGEETVYKTILTPEKYYIKDLSIGVWNQLPQSEIELVRGALSDFQINLKAQAERLHKAAADFEVESQEGVYVLSLREGAEETGIELLQDLLESTFGGAEFLANIKDSIKINRLVYQVTLDAETYYPVKLYVDTDMTLAIDPGSPMEMTQQLTADYSKFNAITPIEVPEDALEAPELDPSISPEDLEELENLEGLEEELEGLQGQEGLNGTDGSGNAGGDGAADDEPASEGAEQQP
ncbi:hypothetical protein DNH61_00425 [Paenibacillus sambharensis]|uniref:Lipoprotein n=1 Tax=Paenibacillus sambharensis TaxID=1803190 RepID=A0A2W1LSM3_9BACL|nr:DUF6612 family protein [Paenibacillus sambharensis]PZD97765.1 hypothetical protein DNH61_00425 [Paenibacillus sambharensis]